MQMENLIKEINAADVNLNEVALFSDGYVHTHRFRPDSNCDDCYSVAKTFTMTAIGMLSDDGLLDVKKPIADYMHNLMPKDIDKAWEQVTVEHALTHRIGFGEGFLDIDVEDVTKYPTSDYLFLVFSHPLSYRPGEQKQYSDAAFYLLSRLVSNIAGEKLDDFLNERLFQPLHFHEFAWSHCPQNFPMGATGLYIGAEDMLKLPMLFLGDGVFEGKRIVSESWVKCAIANGYELHSQTPSGFIGKRGMYGQIILFNKERNCAIAWLGHTTNQTKMQQLITELDLIL